MLIKFKKAVLRSGLMGKLIFEPPKIYIDTGHLINIANLRHGKRLPPKQSVKTYEFIDDCIMNRHFGIIYYPAAAMEWISGGATSESAAEIAAVIDSAKLKYQLLETDTAVYQSEVLQECHRRNPDIEILNLPILQQLIPGESVTLAIGILANAVPGYIEEKYLPPYVENFDSHPTAKAFVSVQFEVAHAFGYTKRNPGFYEEGIRGYKESLEIDIDLYRRGYKPDKVAWMKRFLHMDKILAAQNLGMDLDAILELVDLERCPATSLYFKARVKRVRAGHAATDNEVEDWLFLPVVPYADLVLTDRGFRHFIHQADSRLRSTVISNPEEAKTILQRWT